MDPAVLHGHADGLTLGSAPCRLEPRLDGELHVADLLEVGHVSDRLMFEGINPGNSIEGYVFFDVPKGTTVSKLELHDSMLSGGITVRLWAAFAPTCSE